MSNVKGAEMIQIKRELTFVSELMTNGGDERFVLS